ncbi:MAG: FHA domain-containing protein, partial [Deltaproteobacteria bacterium]|nr:FHA domain-containing protein [Deltaproteobacteria bacterium]
MMEGFGKTSITIGSASYCDVVLSGEGVAPEHARLIHQGNGQLLFTNLEQGVTVAGGRQMAPGEHAFFDFHAPFTLGSVELPHDHPAIALMLMAPGELSAQPGRIIVGRAAGQATLVIQHPSVSNLHATLALDEGTVTDHDSASGTFLAGERIASGVAAVLPQEGTLYVGAVPITAALLAELGRAIAAQPGKPLTRAQPVVAVPGD